MTPAPPKSATVALVGPLPPPANGMSVVTETIMRSAGELSLIQLRHVDTSDHRPLATIGRWDGRNILLGLGHALRLIKVLARERPELVHLPVARSRTAFLRDVLFIFAARVTNRELIVHLHSRDFHAFADREPFVIRWVIRRSLAPPVYGVVLGEARRNDFRGYISAKRVFAVPNGVEDVGEGDAQRMREPLVLHLATLWRPKGVFDVLESAVRLRSLVPGLRVILAGEWYRESERVEALKFIGQHGLDDVVALSGPVSGIAKRRLLQSAAVMAFPTRYDYEGHPLVLLEALSAGTPVVATPIGAIPEIMEDGIEGFFVRVGDAAALADRLAAILRNCDLRTVMGRAARRRYEAHFTAEAFVHRLENVWVKVLGQPGGS